MMVISAITLFFLCVGCCGFGYYAVFYTALPLSYIERILEESGDVEIEGLAGSLTSGFSVKQWRWRDEDGNWSSMNDVEFRWNGIYELANEKRFVIEKFTVGSAEIYYQPSDGSTPRARKSDHQDLEDGEDGEMPDRSIRGTPPLREFRIDEFRLSNMTFINTDTKIRFGINEISVDSFQMLDEQMTELGDVTIESDFIEFHSEHSGRFRDTPPRSVQRKFTGVVRSGIDKRLTKDFKYEVDVCFAKDGLLFDAALFDGKVKYSGNPDGEMSVQCKDFSPAEYLTLENTILPKNVSGEFQAKNAAKGGDVKLTVAAESSLQLGETKFTFAAQEFEFPENAEFTSEMTASGTLDGAEVKLHLTVFKDRTELAMILESEAEEDSVDLYAKVFFGKRFEELGDEQKATVRHMMNQRNTIIDKS